ncbi:unnamed protein product [Macrosiphum euphorbiae]|nr:unnamed protein product [Macrosiphum euphorbiae]
MRHDTKGYSIIYNINIICELLLRDEEMENESLTNIIPKKRKPFNSLFSTRNSEGFFKSLIGGHLINDDEQFREFFRLNRKQFNFILSLVQEVMTKKPT